MPAAIQPERILKDLGDLWLNLATPEPGAPASNSVLRACAMTLIVALEDAEDSQEAAEVIAELMHEHPSRAIVLKPNARGELDARVFAQCWMPAGGRRQICCEQIDISACHERLGDVPPLMLALLAPDLPVVLWCRGERWFSEPHFNRLLPLVDKLIVDSARFADPAPALALIGEWISGGRRVADLAWARITGWREIVARMFDTPAESASLPAIRHIRVGYAGGRPDPEAAYLAAWLGTAIPRIAPSTEPSGRDGKGICSIDLDVVTFRLQADSSVEVRTPALAHTALLPPSGDYHAMREELAITRRDIIFENLLPAARRLIEER